jgi:outer membrane protein W
MKAVKLLFAALAMTFAMNASAQDDGRYALDVKFGVITPGSQGAFGIGFGYQKDIKDFGNWTLAWDVATLEYEAPFNSPADLDYLSAKTGLRLFSPTFCGDKLRAYTNLGVGYTCVLAKQYNFGTYLDPITGIPVSVSEESMKGNHGFGLTFGFGIQINQKWSIGYTLQYETAFKTKNHFGTIGIAF